MTLRETVANHMFRLVSRANDPFIAGGIAAAIVGQFHELWLGGFVIGFYSWHAAGLFVKCAHGVRVEDPDDVTGIIQDGDGGDPYLPMTAMGTAFGVPLTAWYTVGIPFLPDPGAAWTAGQLVLAAVGGVAWFLVSTITVMLSVLLCVDGLRRLSGRRGIQWFPDD